MARALVLFEKCNEKELKHRIFEMRGLLSSLHISDEVLVVRIDNVSKSTYIGKGSVENIKQFIEYEDAGENPFDFIVTDFNLTGMQKDHLEEAFNKDIIDRNMVILKVFV